MRVFSRARLGVLTYFICGMIAAAPLMAGVVVLKNGVRLEGRLGKASSIGANALAAPAPSGGVNVTKIVIVDDDLRRIFVSTNQVASVTESEAVVEEKIRIRQRVAHSGRRIGSVGPIIGVTPFDEWGRRTFSMMSAKGRLDIIQGITEVTPRFVKVEGLLVGKNSYVWDTRVATSSIPRTLLSKILMRGVDTTKPDARMRIVRLYIQAERYKDARVELEGLLKDFPDLKELKKQIKTLRQLGARRLLRELELRRSAGQHFLVQQMLAKFPDQEVAGEILLRVRDGSNEYQQMRQDGANIVALLKKYITQLPEPAMRRRLEPVLTEIESELGFNTLARMDDLLRLADDKDLPVDQKVSLGVSAWLLGPGEGVENLSVAISLFRVRNLIREYLRSASIQDREHILEQLRSEEGGAPHYLAKLVGAMKPALQTAPSENGLHGLTIPGLQDSEEFSYFVQLPPEYDPYRQYPCIVTLNGSGTSPTQQIDWWAGAQSEKSGRLGQATRRGYIVIAPKWSKGFQSDYEYSAREHAAVLYSLRDACRRFSINTDRVFLSGHSMGGDAAWDIGLSHPDLWAGVVPIVAKAGRYVSRYWENARRTLPLYFVGGEMDGNLMERNTRDFDRYLKKVGYDLIIVEYQGRGHEHFHDEIQNIFDWMDLQERNFTPQDFKCASMRSWDNFFWWAELSDFPEKSQVSAADWPPKSGARAAMTEGRILLKNRLSLKTAAASAVFWLSPDLVDFEQPVHLTFNGRGRPISLQPSAKVLLEDVRTRADRRRPFWAKITSEELRKRKAR